jgi:hypothetical protein
VIRVRTHANVSAFLDRAGQWLLHAEHRYGLLLGIANQVLGGAHRLRPPL